ncbi:MAG: sensor histidine kinase [Clostridia bacterium]|nr:sensor histidine kinase [Clostridia bacterium]
MNVFSEVFLKIFVVFLFEFLLFIWLTVKKEGKKNLFWMRAILGVLTIFLTAFGISFLYPIVGENVFGRISLYVVLFVVAMVTLPHVYDVTYTTSLLYCSLAYSAQNVAYKVFSTVWVLIKNFGLDNWGANYELFYRLIYYFLFGVSATLLYFAFIKKLTEKNFGRNYNKVTMTISVLILTVTIVLCSIEDVFFSRLAADGESYFDNQAYVVLRETGNVFSLICLIITMFLLTATVEQNEMQQEIGYLQHAIEHGKWQYEMRRDIVEMVNVKVHDIRYKINALLAQKENVNSDEIEKLKESVFIYDSVVDTGNRLLNVILSEKRLYCEQNGIKFTCMADGEKLSFMSDGDLYTFFGNILDNALEAVNKLEDKNKKIISIVVKCKNDMLILQEENYFEGNLTYENGLPKTVKVDSANHGFGLKSIRMIAQKYGGEISVYTTGEVFHLNVIFSLN